MKPLVVALALAASTIPAYASEYPSDAELGTLPSFCTVKLKMRGSPQEKAEIARYGRANWEHIHHYCVALVSVERARRAANPGQVQVYLKTAAEQYEYVNGGFEKTFWLRPQIYLEYGKVLVRLNRQNDAVRLFSDAVKLSPAYLAAYLSLIDTYKTLGMKPAALDAATAGLRNLPDAKALQQAYLDLGGQRPFPEPAQARPAEPPSTTEVARPESPARENVPASSAEKSSASAPPGETGEAASDAAGRSCRFCPPEEIQKKWRESFSEPAKQ